MKKLAALLVLIAPAFAQAAMPVHSARIGQGVEAWYAENPAVPVVHVILSFKGAGSVSDPADKAGRAALAAAMLTEGAGAYDALGFQQAMEDKAITIEAEASDDRLTIHIHALREQAEAAGALLAAALGQPHFAPDDLARVKGQTRSLLAQLDESPSYRAARKFEETAFAGHPYASPHYGTPDSINAITADDLRGFVSTYLGRRNLQITAAGDVDESLLRGMLKPVVEALGDSDAGAQPIAAAPMQGAGQAVTVAMPVPQSFVLFAAPAMPRQDPRFYAYYLLNEILGGNALTSRLADGVRQKKGLVYSVGTAIDEREGVSLLRGVFASRTDRTAEATATVKSVLDALRTRGATNDECEDARTHVIGGFTLQLDGSRSVAEILMMMRMFDLGIHYLDEREQKFRDVKCSEVNAVAVDLLAPEKFLFITAGAP